VKLDEGLVKDTLEAMRSVETEADRWVLCDALVKLVPEGERGFDVLWDRAISDKILPAKGGKLSKTTLKLYRNTGKLWPAKDRVPGVSFSGHREFEIVDASKRAKMLKDLAAQGPVTIKTIRAAAAAATGKNLPAPKVAAAPVMTGQVGDVLADLKAGGARLIKAITVQTSLEDLLELKRGLNKVLGHVEALESRKNAKPAVRPTPQEAVAGVVKKVAARKPADAKRKPGDLRNL
jgi:hypothetical protein